MQRTPSSSRIVFGLFEADLNTQELWKSGYRVKLQSQPFKVLSVLIEHAGELVTREELQRIAWGSEVTVDFERSLGSAVKKIREALGDSAENPRFIETLARRGYRFIAPVSLPPHARLPENMPDEASDVSEIVMADTIVDAQTPPTSFEVKKFHLVRVLRTPLWATILFSASLGALLASFFVGGWLDRHTFSSPLRISAVTRNGRIYSPGDAYPSFEILPSAAIDGGRIFSSVVDHGRIHLSQISLASGEMQPLLLPAEIEGPRIDDISPDGGKLLVQGGNTTYSEQALWVVPTDGGSAYRISNIVAHDATWMPDGKEVLYANGSELNVISLMDGSLKHFAIVPGNALWLRWSPDGKLLRFTVLNPNRHTSSLWEISSAGAKATPVLAKWSSSFAIVCCGSWTTDRRSYVFQAAEEDGSSDLWMLRTKVPAEPVRITNGPLRYGAPIAARDGGRIYFTGLDADSHLERYEEQQHIFVRVPEFLTGARRIVYSRDRQWVAWTDSFGHLWRAKIDGSEKLQLTPDSLQVFVAAWSPDGTQIVLMARYPSQLWQVYLIKANGGNPEHVFDQDHNVGDPSFSADGKFLAAGGVPYTMGESHPRPIEIIELATGRISELPGSNGMFSPRWSPSGRYIAALTLDRSQLALYDLQTKSWRQIGNPGAADPTWSLDSQAIYFQATAEAGTPIVRAIVPNGQLTEVVSLKDVAKADNAQYHFSGLTPENMPLIQVETMNTNFYTTDLSPR